MRSACQAPASCKVQTPYRLAASIVRYLGDAPNAKWLEPSCGEGAFLMALRKAGVSQARITGIDLDETESPEDSAARIRRGMDFLPWSARNKRKFDRVVGNPPFARLCKLAPSLREAALRRFAQSDIPVPGTSNYWLPFLLASLDCLRVGGSLGFILPAAWDFASYAQPLRESIGDVFREVEVHRSKRPLFQGNQDGNVVLVCRGYREGRCIPSRYEYENNDALCKALIGGAVPAPVPTPSTTQRSRSRKPYRTVPAQSVFSIRIGAVTGDNAFFLLTERQRHERGLPLSSLARVVTRARQIRTSEVNKRSWIRLRDSRERVWLFHPSDDDTALPAVQRYLRDGGCDRSRHKISSREVWYRTPLPGSAHGFMSGMSKDSPWICLNRMKGLTATNTLYVVEFHGQPALAEKAAWCLSLLHPIAREAARTVSRVYGDGLGKLEPSDIGGLPLVVPRVEGDPLAVYREAAAYLFNGDPEACERTAEYWFRS